MQQHDEQREHEPAPIQRNVAATTPHRPTDAHGGIDPVGDQLPPEYASDAGDDERTAQTERSFSPIDPSTISPLDLARTLAERGVTLRSDGTHLNVDDPNEAVTPDVHAALWRLRALFVRALAPEHGDGAGGERWTSAHGPIHVRIRHASEIAAEHAGEEHSGNEPAVAERTGTDSQNTGTPTPHARSPHAWRPFDPSAITLDALATVLAERGIGLRTDGTHLDADDPDDAVTLDVRAALWRFRESLVRALVTTAGDDARRERTAYPPAPIHVRVWRKQNKPLGHADDGATEHRHADREEAEQEESERASQDARTPPRRTWSPIDPATIPFGDLLLAIIERGITFTRTSGDGRLEWIDPHNAMTPDLAIAIARNRKGLIDALGPSRLPSDEERQAGRHRPRRQ